VLPKLFEQYTRELLFSSMVELMSVVVCAIHPGVHAAYRARAKERSLLQDLQFKKLECQ
jgi:hypothetical protein